MILRRSRKTVSEWKDGRGLSRLLPGEAQIGNDVYWRAWSSCQAAGNDTSDMSAPGTLTAVP